jgi:hypothetical protein
VLIASGFIVGESLFNVALAGLIVATNKGEPLAVPFAPSEHIGMILALIAAAICTAVRALQLGAQGGGQDGRKRRQGQTAIVNPAEAGMAVAR